mgnify:CR=1 FL=1
MWDKNQGKYCLTGDLYPFFSHSGYKSLVNQRFLSLEEAQQRLLALGFEVSCVVYRSRRGVDGADSSRVIRQRGVGHNKIEITVSDFRTQAG